MAPAGLHAGLRGCHLTADLVAAATGGRLRVAGLVFRSGFRWNLTDFEGFRASFRRGIRETTDLREDVGLEERHQL